MAALSCSDLMTCTTLSAGANDLEVSLGLFLQRDVRKIRDAAKTC